jgi:hypothetical protein
MKGPIMKMKLPELALKVLLTWVALMVAQMIAGLLVPAGFAVAANVLPGFLISNILVAGVLVFAAMRSDWRGWRLAAALSAIPLVINLANYIEGKLFLTSYGIRWGWVIGYPLVTAALTIPLWLLIFGKRPGDSEVNYRPYQLRSPGQRLWRFAISALAYACLYFIAGTIVIQYVGDFYATQTLPPTGMLFALQLFVRGPAYVVICLLLVRMLGLSRRTGALAVGLVFAIVNGIAPLLIPSGIFPDYVRWAHLYEVASSNFLFGAFVAWLWGEPEPDSKAHFAASSAGASAVN